MTDRDLMQQALDALKLIDEAMPFPVAKLTIKNLNERLAQPEQEPVAWMFQHDETGRMNYVSNDGIHNPTMFLEMNPRYALVCPLYTTPAQRRPLTVCEIVDAIQPFYQNRGFAEMAVKVRIDDYRAIEAKLKERNT